VARPGFSSRDRLDKGDSRAANQPRTHCTETMERRLCHPHAMDAPPCHSSCTDCRRFLALNTWSINCSTLGHRRQAGRRLGIMISDQGNSRQQSNSHNQRIQSTCDGYSCAWLSLTCFGGPHRGCHSLLPRTSNQDSCSSGPFSYLGILRQIILSALFLLHLMIPGWPWIGLQFENGLDTVQQ
jgi:hypothetical protein